MLATIVVAAAATVAVTASAYASTGSYQVTACNAAPEALNHSWTWASSDTSSPDHYSKWEDCPDRTGGSGGTSDQQGGLSTTDTLGLSNGAPPGTSAGWSFTAPTGTTITGITYERYLGHTKDPDNYWSPALRANGKIVSGETCADTAPAESCFVGGPPGEGGEPSTVTGLSAHELALSVVCEAAAAQECITGAIEHKAWAAMYGATVTLSDTTPPTLGTPSGPLWEAGRYGGFHKGTETVTVEAKDVGGGLQSIVLTADGQPVESYQASCNFTYPRPCPSSTGPQTLTLPTGQLTDGTHTLTLVAVDAAGNQSTLASEQVTIDNDPPSAPLDLAATPVQEGSSTFTATWSDPSGQVAPISQATYQVCPASGSGECSTPASAPPAGPASVSVPGPGAWTLAVWLTDAAGNGSPAEAAHVNLSVPEPKAAGESSAGSGQAGGSGQSGSGSGQGSTGGASGTAGNGSGGPGTGGSTGSGHGHPGGNAKLRLRVRLHGRRLIVHLRGPASAHGRVRVSYLARYRGRRIGRAVRRVKLKHGRLRAIFRLSARAAARAMILVKATLGKRSAVCRRVRRRRVRRALSGVASQEASPGLPGLTSIWTASQLDRCALPRGNVAGRGVSADCAAAPVSAPQPQRSVVPNRRAEALRQARRSPARRLAQGQPCRSASGPSQAIDRQPGRWRLRACAAG